VTVPYIGLQRVNPSLVLFTPFPCQRGEGMGSRTDFVRPQSRVAWVCSPKRVVSLTQSLIHGESPIAIMYREGNIKRTLRRESKAPETVGREAMDAGDPLPGAVRDARMRARQAVAKRYRKMECSCLLPCCWASQGVRWCGRGVPQFVSLSCTCVMVTAPD